MDHATSTQTETAETRKHNAIVRAKARAEHDLEKAKNEGWSFAGNRLYAVGTAVNDGCYRDSRLSYEARPFVNEALGEVENIYRAECREDHTFPITQLWMTDVGGISAKPRIDANRTNGARISPWALGQLVQRAGGPGSSTGYLRESPLQHRQGCVNFWLPRGITVPRGKDEQGQARAAVPVEVKLRSKLDSVTNRDGSVERVRGIYAAVSPSFNSNFDMPVAAKAFVAAIERHLPHARGSFFYDGRKWRFTAHLHSTFADDVCVVGDVFRGAVFCEGADDGSSAINFGAEIEQARCVNLTTILAKQFAAAIRHNEKALGEKFDTALSAAVKRIDGFSSVWAEAAKDEIINRALNEAAPKLAFESLVAQKLVWVSGVSAEELVSRLVTAWEFEPGYSRAHVVSAITRAAHTESWINPWTTEDLQAQAGQLVYQTVSLAPVAQRASAGGSVLEID